MTKNNIEKYGRIAEQIGFAKGFIVAMILVAITLLISKLEPIIEFTNNLLPL